MSKTVLAYYIHIMTQFVLHNFMIKYHYYLHLIATETKLYRGRCCESAKVKHVRWGDKIQIKQKFSGTMLFSGHTVPRKASKLLKLCLIKRQKVLKSQGMLLSSPKVILYFSLHLKIILLGLINCISFKKTKTY